MLNRKGRWIGLFVFFLVWPVLCSVPRASGYLAEDSFTPYWLEPKQAFREQATERATGAPPLTYEVKQGDTLWGLARRVELDPETIRSANGLKENAVLRPGQILVLPVQAELTHRVAPGETLWSLAQRYRVSVARLMAWNQIKDPAGLAVGKELIIPGRRNTTARSLESQRNAARGGDDALAWPLLGEITSFFGPRGDEFHHGLDIAGEVSDLVRAAQEGEVIFTGWLGVYGKTVMLEHSNGNKTLYGHLQDILVETGDFVEKGRTIARVGSSGRATGPHLHFELRQNDRAVNPLPYLSR
ncbi:MAG: M23 family metallopeptidase [Bacillota bacterium]|nr:M23 family metallopeptidase [Bacillota bacterium]